MDVENLKEELNEVINSLFLLFLEFKDFGNLIVEISDYFI